MADLLIKPLTGAGNTVTIQDQAGGAILTSGNSGATIANATITNATITADALTVTGSTGLGWRLLETQTPLNVGSVTMGSASLIDSTYDEYVVVGSQVCPPVTDAQLLFQATLGGTNRGDNWKTMSKGFDTSATSRNTTSGSYAHAFIAGGANIQSSLNYGGINFTMYLNSPSIAQRHIIWGNCSYRNSSGFGQYNYFEAHRETDVGALTAIKFFMSSGNMTGTIKLYGLSK